MTRLIDSRSLFSEATTYSSVINLSFVYNIRKCLQTDQYLNRPVKSWPALFDFALVKLEEHMNN